MLVAISARVRVHRCRRLCLPIDKEEHRTQGHRLATKISSCLHSTDVLDNKRCDHQTTSLNEHAKQNVFDIINFSDRFSQRGCFGINFATHTYTSGFLVTHAGSWLGSSKHVRCLIS